MNRPSYLEEDLSKVPALHLLLHLGYAFLPKAAALAARGGRTASVLLEEVLRASLRRLNPVAYRGREYALDESNVEAAVLALRNLPLHDGLLAANHAGYDLLTLGRSFEQTIAGDKRSVSVRYVDWENWENNVFHVAQEFAVARTGQGSTYRPDVVLFVNGIPLVVIECKSPRNKRPLPEAIAQQLEYQKEDGIRPLYQYSQVLLALAESEARYATTATTAEFWSVWKEQVPEADLRAARFALTTRKNTPLPTNDRAALLNDLSDEARAYYEALFGGGPVLLTPQDELLHDVCRPARLLDLVYNFTVFDEGVKKIARYQQFFTIRQTLDRVGRQEYIDAPRQGGVIWHTQGSGKSLTMVMLAQLLAKHPTIKNPKILLVTDRVDLDDQLFETFHKCKREVVQATTGASEAILRKLNGQSDPEEEDDWKNPKKKKKRDTSLLALLHERSDDIVTTVINKFEAALKQSVAPFTSSDVFILVDEAHRTQHGSFHSQMRRLFPKACFLGFTGTPLMRQEKNTAEKFGGLIKPVYSIADAVADGAVVPLLYEGRHHALRVNVEPLDRGFERISEPLPDYGKAELKRKFSRQEIIDETEQVVEARAWDIVAHFNASLKNTGLKAQLVVRRKSTAIKYKELIDKIGELNPERRVTCEVVISPPGELEGDDESDAGENRVKRFWKTMMERFENKPEQYEKRIIAAFKKHEVPELLIVVSKLLTGFDAPANTVLYIAKEMKEHTLLQAIARVNRVHPGKEHGLIIDYHGNLENLDKALNQYSALSQYDAEDLDGAIVNVKRVIEELPGAHAKLWDGFKTLPNRYDKAAYSEWLHDNDRREVFYEAVSTFARRLKLALTSVEFSEETPAERLEAYRNDARFFLDLRQEVRRRYFDVLDYSVYEPQIQKLLDQHISTEGETLRVTRQIDLFNAAERRTEVERLTGKAAQADHIASRTLRAIEVKAEEDPAYFKKLATLIEDTIAAYHQHRLNEGEYWQQVRELEDRFHGNTRDDLPRELRENPVAAAFHGLAKTAFNAPLDGAAGAESLLSALALGVDAVVRREIMEGDRLKVDWQQNPDLAGRIWIRADDFLFDLFRENALTIPLSVVDEFIEACVSIAKLRYR